MWLSVPPQLPSLPSLSPQPFFSLRSFWNFTLSAHAIILKDGVCVSVRPSVCFPPPPLSLLLQPLHGLCSRSVDSFVLCEMTFIVFLWLQTEYVFAVEKAEISRECVQKTIK